MSRWWRGRPDAVTVFHGKSGAELRIFQEAGTLHVRGRAPGSDVVHLLDEQPAKERRPAAAWRERIVRRMWKEHQPAFVDVVNEASRWMIQQGYLR